MAKKKSTVNVEEVMAENDLLEKEPLETINKEEPKKEAPTAKKYKVVNCVMLNVRQSPSTTAKVIGCLNGGAVVEGTPCGDPAWVQVQSVSISGYCMKQFLEVI